VASILTRRIATVKVVPADAHSVSGAISVEDGSTLSASRLSMGVISGNLADDHCPEGLRMGPVRLTVISAFKARPIKWGDG
jgi:hypothetical protein